MGRTNKRSESALKAAAEMLETTKNQTLKVQLIRMIIDHDLRQQERADSHKAERHKRAEKKELAELRSNAKELADKLCSVERSKEKEVSDIRSELAEQKVTLATCKNDLAIKKRMADEARATAAEMERRQAVAQELTVQLARNVSAASRFDSASQLFQKLKSDSTELLDQLFKSMELDLKTWRSWDMEYGDSDDLMLQVVLSPEKHEPGKRSLIRSKLAAIGKDYVDAINAVHDYRDLKISLDELKERTCPHISFVDLDVPYLPMTNRIPEKHMPRLTRKALCIASEQLKNDGLRKLEWLSAMQKLLKADEGVSLLLLMELQATRCQVSELNRR